MKILAIDPGTTQSAYVCYYEGRPVEFAIVENEILDSRLKQFTADVMAIEMPACYGMVVGKDILETCEWVGIFRKSFGLARSFKVYRKSRNIKDGIDGVCMHLCKNNTAKDSNVRQAIIDRFEPTGGGATPQKGTKGKPGPLFGVSKDIWAALGVAITYAETMQGNRK